MSNKSGGGGGGESWGGGIEWSFRSLFTFLGRSHGPQRSYGNHRLEQMSPYSWVRPIFSRPATSCACSKRCLLLESPLLNRGSQTTFDPAPLRDSLQGFPHRRPYTKCTKHRPPAGNTVAPKSSKWISQGLCGISGDFAILVLLVGEILCWRFPWCSWCGK